MKHCKNYIQGYCRKGIYVEPKNKSIKCPYNDELTASLDCEYFINEDINKIVSVFNIQKIDEDLKCEVSIKTELGMIKIDNVFICKYHDGFLGYIVKIDMDRDIKLSNKLEHEIISEVRKYIKKVNTLL